MTSKASLWVAVFCGVLALLWSVAWFVSPRFYASSIATAATTNDLGTLVKRLDVERLRSAAVEDLTDVALSTFELPDGKGISEALRVALTQAVKAVHPGDDHAVTEKVANLITGKGFISRTTFALVPREALAKRTAESAGEFGDTYDVFFHRIRFKETGEELALMLERRAVFSWRLVAIKTNGGSVLTPLRMPKLN